MFAHAITIRANSGSNYPSTITTFAHHDLLVGMSTLQSMLAPSVTNVT